MFVNTIMGGKSAMDALLYKAPDTGFLNYLQNNIQQAYNATVNYSNQFKDAVVGLFNKANSQEVINAGKMLLFNTGTHVSQDVVYTVPYDNIQSANLRMQQYIMSNLEIQQLYNRNMCNGFSDTYINLEPDNKGKDRYDYMGIMSGVLDFDNEDNGVIRHYSFNNETNNDEITIYERISVLDTWDNVRRRVEEGYDPTDVDGGIL